MIMKVFLNYVLLLIIVAIWGCQFELAILEKIIFVLVFEKIIFKVEVDGIIFCDFNKNGKLDVYEDVNIFIEEWVEDLFI